MKLGKSIWQEDDCAPDAECLEHAWQRLFGEKFDSANAVEREDYGDCEFVRMPNGKVACLSYRGNNGIFEAHE